jgi:hypothetical protein
MTRPSLPLPSVIVVLCLLAQGALLYYTGRWAEAPHLLLLFLFCGLAVVAGAAALLSWRQGAGHRPRLWVLLTMELSLLLVAGASLSVGDEEPEAWVAEGRRALAATVDRQEMLLVRLEAAVAEIALEATRHDSCGDPFDLLAGLSEQWTDRFPAADRYPLAVTLWQDGERIAWDAHGTGAISCR